MDNIRSSVEVRMGCDSCGHEAVYRVPKRRYITEFNHDDPTNIVYSSAAHFDGTDQHILLCQYCDLPCLKVFWFKDELEPAKEEAHRG